MHQLSSGSVALILSMLFHLSLPSAGKTGLTLLWLRQSLSSTACLPALVHRAEAGSQEVSGSMKRLLKTWSQNWHTVLPNFIAQYKSYCPPTFKGKGNRLQLLLRDAAKLYAKGWEFRKGCRIVVMFTKYPCVLEKVHCFLPLGNR